MKIEFWFPDGIPKILYANSHKLLFPSCFTNFTVLAGFTQKFIKYSCVNVFQFLLCIKFFLRISLLAAELKMDVLREREVKDSLERQLAEEQKLRGKFDFFPECSSVCTTNFSVIRIFQHFTRSLCDFEIGKGLNREDDSFLF